MKFYKNIQVQKQIHERFITLGIFLDQRKVWIIIITIVIDIRDMLQVIHFAKSDNENIQQSKLTSLSGAKRDSQQDVILLGIVLDRALNIKKHIHQKVTSTRKAVSAIWKYGGTKLGEKKSAI